MAVNKVEVDGEVKLDLTQDTVTPETLLPGATAHNAAGEQIAGTAAAVLYTDQALTADQQSQARSNIGAAPSGYGVGEIIPDNPAIGTLADLDATEKSGLYYYNSNEAIGGFPYGQYGMVLVLSTAGVKRQYFFPRATDSRWWVRQKTNYADTWGEWEFGKVPLERGVEYRTTERYLGKPVYAIVVDCGIVPTTGEKDVPLTDIANSNHVVSAFFEAYADAGFKQSVPNSTLTAYWLSGNQGTAIRIAATNDVWNANSYHVYAHLKYTKTTD